MDESIQILKTPRKERVRTGLCIVCETDRGKVQFFGSSRNDENLNLLRRLRLPCWIGARLTHPKHESEIKYFVHEYEPIAVDPADFRDDI